MKKEIQIKNGALYYNGFNLEELADKYGTPLKVSFLDLIKDRVLGLKASFDKAIKDNDYHGKFIYLNANKANYESLEVKEALIHADGLETSSHLDLVMTKELVEEYGDSNKLIYSNGCKEQAYMDEIIDANEKGMKICGIIDSMDEYEYYCENAKKELEVGLRIHLPSLYPDVTTEKYNISNDRFGLMKDEYDFIIKDLINHPNLKLTTIHFHQRGFDFEKDKFLENIDKVFSYYYVNAKNKYDSVVNFDMGGGTPLPVDDEFDYYNWAKILIDYLKDVSKKNNIEEPNIISENGKYSVKDSLVNIYEVVKEKRTENYPWKLINGSLMIAMPEMFALGEPLMIRPINRLNEELEKSLLSSTTCDCDDIYFEKDKGYILIPETKKDKKTYIGIIGTGSYQNSMNGKGGVHHCLLPEEKDLVIWTDEKGKTVYKVRNEVQSFERLKEVLHFNFRK